MQPTHPPRLEDAVDLPLGTVLEDNQGHVYIFIGRCRNTVGLEYHFQPKACAYRGVSMSWNCALEEGCMKKFPGLEKYRK